MKRFIVLFFPHLLADWFAMRMPELQDCPFVLTVTDHGRKIVTAASPLAVLHGIAPGMVLADARALAAGLQAMDQQPDDAQKLLDKLARWCIRYAPVVATDVPDGLIIDASGCAHLWGGETPYIKNIVDKLSAYGYHIKAAMADTVGAAWAAARYNGALSILPSGDHGRYLLSFPPAALRLPPEIVGRLQKLGFSDIAGFAAMPRNALRRRFGELLLARLDQALGKVPEPITGVVIPEPFEQRLACLEPIVTRRGIEIALSQLLDQLCQRLQKEGKGVRAATFQLWRIDGHFQQVSIGTVRPSCNTAHLMKLFEEKISSIAPGNGIEVFCLQATSVEDSLPAQDKFWSATTALANQQLTELVDRVTNRLGDVMCRYLPQEHFWPERSFKPTKSLTEQTTAAWDKDSHWPIQLLAAPELIVVTAPIPDLPPINFRYKDVLHTVRRADGPIRIEREWWIDDGKHRDYYQVEDTNGQRYFVFRLGHYDPEKTYGWYMHGFFA